jgi:predicted porin
MKRKILPVILSSMAAMTAQPALADIELYGKINLTLQTVEEDGYFYNNAGDVEFGEVQDTIKLNSNSSRLGFKGSADITDVLKAVYKLEYAVYPDDGANGPFKTRNAYIGLAAQDIGTFLAGQHDTPLKMSHKDVDLFNDLYLGDVLNIMSGEVRAPNLIAYFSPDINGFGLSVALISGEESDVKEVDSSGNVSAKNDRSGIGDGISAAATYRMDGLYLALAVDQDVIGGNILSTLLRGDEDLEDEFILNSTEEQNRIRLSAQYTIDAFTLGGIFQTAESSDTGQMDLEETSLLLSGSYKIENWKLKLQYGMTTATINSVHDNNNNEIPINDDEIDIDLFLAGADYSLSKETTVFGYYGKQTVDMNGFGYVGGPQYRDEPEKSTLAIGIEHKF